MGQYCAYVNIDKQQFLNQDPFDEGVKFIELPGSRLTMFSFSLLMSQRCWDPGEGGDMQGADHPLVGSWVGDRVILAGEYGERGQHLTAEQIAHARNEPDLDVRSQVCGSGEYEHDPVLYKYALNYWADVGPELAAILGQNRMGPVTTPDKEWAQHQLFKTRRKFVEFAGRELEQDCRWIGNSALLDLIYACRSPEHTKIMKELLLSRNLAPFYRTLVHSLEYDEEYGRAVVNEDVKDTALRQRGLFRAPEAFYDIQVKLTKAAKETAKT